jgi:hypothetical protein
VLIVMLSACGAQYDWRELKTDQGFVAALPGRPQNATREIDVGGKRVELTLWSTGVGPTMFAIGTARLPPAAIADAEALPRTIAYFRDALVRNIGGTVTQRTPAALSLAPGDTRRVLAAEEISAIGRPGQDGRPTRLAARFFIVDDRFFEIVALGAEGEIPPAVLETFFTSFRLA